MRLSRTCKQHKQRPLPQSIQGSGRFTTRKALLIQPRSKEGAQLLLFYAPRYCHTASAGFGRRFAKSPALSRLWRRYSSAAAAQASPDFCSIPFTAGDICYGDLSRESGKDFAQWLEGRDYTAAYIGNNYMAAGAVHQLQKMGRSVPKDISIICFDDSPLVNENGLNLTTISCDPQEIGQATAETLLKRMADPLGRRLKMIFSPQLNLRGSVAPRK